MEDQWNLEEIYLNIGDHSLLKEYQLLDMYSVCEKLEIKETERKCGVCDEVKPIDEFKRNVSSGYIYNQCVKCYNKYHYQRRKNKNK